MEALLKKYCLLKPGKRPDLSDWPTRIPRDELPSKDEAHDLLHDLGKELAELQWRLWAGRTKRLLVVLQGMDTSGKDGTIRHVFGKMNPHGVQIAPFDKPTKRELSYDYLWRVHQCVPHNGQIVVFDRSHYEDVLTVRVKKLKPKSVWEKRFAHINAFEQMLADEGTAIVKIFLHISRDEQRERLTARLNDPRKHWKFDISDIEARSSWNDYEEAYADVFERCNPKHAPWHIIPADKKWQRNILVAQLIKETLEGLEPKFPKADSSIKDIVIE